MIRHCIARRRWNRVSRAALESLETRLCLSCEVYKEGTTLFVIGDEGDNHLVIEEAGAIVAVTCHDNPAADAAPRTFEGVASIVVRTGEGNDRVVHTVKGPETGPASTSVELGSGKDSLNVEGSDLGRSLWRYSISAGADDDTVDLNLTEVFGGSFRVDLGAGNDAFGGSAAIGTPREEPQPQAASLNDRPIRPPVFLPARLSFEVFGGEGNDQLSFDAKALTTPSSILPRAATLAVHMAGGAGDDSLTTTLGNVLLQGTTLLSMSGGEGNDTSKVAVNGGAVGKLTTRVDLGAGDDSSSINYNWTVSTGRLDTFVSTGSGNDSSVLQAEFEEARSDVSTNVNTGSGNDSSHVSFIPFQGYGKFGVSVTTGEGDDGVFIGGGPSSTRGRVAYSVNSGAGDDRFEISTPAPSSLVSVRLNSGEGSDELEIDFTRPPFYLPPGPIVLASTRSSVFDGIPRPIPRPIPIPQVRPEASWLSTGSGNDKVDLDATHAAEGVGLIVELGTGDDVMAAKLSTQPEPMSPVSVANSTIAPGEPTRPTPFSRLRLNVFAGLGNDQVGIEGGFLNTVGGSDGDDSIRMSNTSAARISAGGGNDDVADEGGFANTIGGDAGNDKIAVTHSSQARLSGGDGSDSISISGGHDNHASGGNHDDNVRAVDLEGTSVVELGNGNDTFEGQHNGAQGPVIALVAIPVNINVFGGTGNDVIRQTIGNPFTDDIGPVFLSGPVNLKFDAGAGDDSAGVHFAKSAIGALSASLLGWDGNDTLNFLAGGDNAGPGSIDLRGNFSVEAHGGFGGDTINVVHAGVLGGSFKARITGDQPDPRAVVPTGGSADQIAVIFRHAEGSNATLEASIAGGVDDDVLTLIAHAAANSEIRSKLLIDGGVGRDKATATKNVDVINCEEVIRIE